jgi:lysozyme
MNENLHLSPAGLELLKNSEGYRGQAYSDVAGFPTIGYGHKIRSSEGFPRWGITEPQALNLLARDVYDAEAAVKRLVRVALTQGQFDALVDFVFNLGAARLEISTLLEYLNHQLYEQAAWQLLRWDHAGHKELAALKARRQSEFNLWMEKAA